MMYRIVWRGPEDDREPNLTHAAIKSSGEFSFAAGLGSVRRCQYPKDVLPLFSLK